MNMHQYCSIQDVQCFLENLQNSQIILLKSLDIRLEVRTWADVDGNRTLKAESQKLVANNLRLIRLVLGLRGDRGVEGNSKESENQKFKVGKVTFEMIFGTKYWRNRHLGQDLQWRRTQQPQAHPNARVTELKQTRKPTKTQTQILNRAA